MTVMAAFKYVNLRPANTSSQRELHWLNSSKMMLSLVVVVVVSENMLLLLNWGAGRNRRVWVTRHACADVMVHRGAHEMSSDRIKHF